MKGAVHTITLPGNFVVDREERDLSCGITTKKGRSIQCVVDDETLRDMVSDADHQATGTDAADSSIVATATRASARLRKYMTELEARAR